MSPGALLENEVWDNALGNDLEKGQKYEVPDRLHSQPQKIKVICVGAGASGLCLAYKAQRELTNYELICYEKYERASRSD